MGYILHPRDIIPHLLGSCGREIHCATYTHEVARIAKAVLPSVKGIANINVIVYGNFQVINDPLGQPFISYWKLTPKESHVR